MARYLRTRTYNTHDNPMAILLRSPSGDFCTVTVQWGAKKPVAPIPSEPDASNQAAQTPGHKRPGNKPVDKLGRVVYAMYNLCIEKQRLFCRTAQLTCAASIARNWADVDSAKYFGGVWRVPAREEGRGDKRRMKRAHLVIHVSSPAYLGVVIGQAKHYAAELGITLVPKEITAKSVKLYCSKSTKGVKS